jgi:1-pyrroline-5-carboxylate dehydrogenase
LLHRTFTRLWGQVGTNLSKYKNFPRLIGECGGKNFHFVHPSADVTTVVNTTIRAAFEYSGQKCSACSRMFVPKSLWPEIKERMIETMKQLKVGPVNDFSVFTSAVIDERAFTRITGYIEHAKKHLVVLQGGEYDKKIGYFIQPTLIETKDPMDKIMREEIFGPVVSVYAYDDTEVEKTLGLVDSSTPYALTGAIFGLDE